MRVVVVSASSASGTRLPLDEFSRRRKANRLGDLSAGFRGPGSLPPSDLGSGISDDRNIFRSPTAPPTASIMSRELPQDHRSRPLANLSNVQQDAPIPWSSFQTQNPTTAWVSDPAVRPPSSTSTLTFADTTSTADPFLSQADRNDLEFTNTQFTRSSRASPSPDSSQYRSSAKPRGAKSWKPLDLTQIEDSENAPSAPENPNLTTNQAPYAVYPPFHYQPRGLTGQRPTSSQPSGPVPPTMLPSSSSQYANPRHNYNSSHQFQPLPSQTARPYVGQNFAPTYPYGQGSLAHHWSNMYSGGRVAQVFGSTLPGPEFLEHVVGARDGQVQFIQHPNGDVSAHQWTEALYHWTNLGQYSNIRKRIEGQLASDRIRGQYSSMLSQLDAVAYFRAVAIQRDPESGHPAPFGPYGMQGLTRNGREDPRSVFDVGYGHYSNPKWHNWSLYGQHATANATGSSPTRGKMHESSQPPDFHEEYDRSTNTTFQQASHQSSRGSGQASEPQRQPSSIQHGPGDYFQDPATETPLNQPHSDPKSRLPDDHIESSQATTASTNTGDIMRDSAAEAPQEKWIYDSGQPVMRTVLHDPLRDSQSGRNDHCDSQHQVISTTSTDQAPVINSHDTLHVSEPDGERTSRPVYDPAHGTDTLDTDPPPSYEESLDDWWQSRNRHRGPANDFEKFAMPIDSNTPPETNKQVTLGLFSALYDTLASYVKDTPQYRYDYFNRFTEPLEWCINKSPNGNQSFFGEDWGTPPSRVGRDPRYRPLNTDSQYAMWAETGRSAGYESRFRRPF
ncbi:MAG: hypothetical protein M1821_005201 [Bathelium mastoideum]|nr:MAG: hypothetical protein M1821_005201 [Bathelium mastoideum]